MTAFLMYSSSSMTPVFLSTAICRRRLLLGRPSSAVSRSFSPNTNTANAQSYRFGLDYPIFQAPHGTAAGPDLAGAVSNAGAMGAIALSLRTPDATREWV